jgi:hypothetical protein
MAPIFEDPVMLKISLLMGVVLALGGCGKKDKVDEIVSGLDDWATKMCACTDKACTEKVMTDYKKWENDVMEPAMKGVDEKSIDKSKMEKGDAADKKRKDCRRKFQDEPGAGATPPAPTAPPAATP